MNRLLIIILLLNFLTSLHVPGQLINQKFTSVLYKDDFENDRGDWKVMSTADNLFLIQEGKYFLHRKNIKSPYSIISNWKNQVSTFEVSVSFSIESAAGPESCVGLIFMAQEDGRGAFIFEINDKKQYRLKQLVGVNFKLLTGSIKSNGWVDSPLLHGSKSTNLVQVKTHERDYDIYINQNYLISFTELAYKTGNIGLSVGPGSRITVDHVAVYGIETSNSGTENSLNEFSGKTGSENSSPEILLEEINLLRQENRMLKDSLEYYRKSENKFHPSQKNP